MSTKKRKWVNQTNIGKQFGLSGIAVGKILIKNGLKDPETKLATQKAIDDGWAISTPMKDGTPYFLWSAQKLESIISVDHKALSKVDYWVNEVNKNFKEANKEYNNGDEKIGRLLADCAYDEVPKEILKEVKEKVEQLTLASN
jgi:hypothetical protein